MQAEGSLGNENQVVAYLLRSIQWLLILRIKPKLFTWAHEANLVPANSSSHSYYYFLTMFQQAVCLSTP